MSQPTGEPLGESVSGITENIAHLGGNFAWIDQEGEYCRMVVRDCHWSLFAHASRRAEGWVIRSPASSAVAHSWAMSCLRTWLTQPRLTLALWASSCTFQVRRGPVSNILTTRVARAEKSE